jgi:predicted AAA+ superfamily ATPase
MERAQLAVLSQRIENEPRKFIQVIYGPRQVGKTTMVQQMLHKTPFAHHYASADAIGTGHSAWISAQWDIARIRFQSNVNREYVLVLDEIQKIDNWSEQVKKEWDSDTRNRIEIKVVLLGSSRILLQQGLTESLAGRFESLYMPHWSYAEMHHEFGMTVDEYVWYGGYPGTASLLRDEERWKEYLLVSLIETSISRDILMLTRVDKPAMMRRLFEIGCAYSGQILSYTKILGQLQDAGNTTTLAHYLNLLDQAGLLAGLQKFSPDTMRQRGSSPKFQVHNTALMSALEAETFRVVRNNRTRWGRMVESAVGAHLVNQCLKYRYELFYWRNRNDEIDFVLSSRDKVIGIEVKSGASGETQGMDAFRQQFNPHRVLLIGGSGLSLEEFLRMEVIDMF